MTGVEFADVGARRGRRVPTPCILVTEWPEFAELDWSEVASGWPVDW